MRSVLRALLIALWMGSATSVSAQSNVVHLYSAQKEHLIRPVLTMFTEQTGITVKLLTGDKAALVTRLEHEGKNTPADLLLTADIGNIYQADQKGLLQPISSKILEENVPQYLQDDDKKWFGLTARARVLFIRKDMLSNAPMHYADLADEEWHDKILIRSSSNVYNQSLMAFMIYHHGEEKAKQWAESIVRNMARAPKGGDRDQLRALAAGEGDIAVANTYYYGMMVAGDESMRDARVTDNVAIVFPNEDTTGVHMNIRGGGVTKHADNREGAIALLEFLSGEEAQRVFAESNLEYPVNPKVHASQKLTGMDTFKVDMTPLREIGALQEKAITLMDAAGWK